MLDKPRAGIGDGTTRWCGEGLRVDIPSPLMTAVIRPSGAGSDECNGFLSTDGAWAEAASEGGAVTVRMLFCDSRLVIT